MQNSSKRSQCCRRSATRQQRTLPLNQPGLLDQFRHVAHDLGDSLRLDEFTGGPIELRTGRTAIARRPELLGHITAGEGRSFATATADACAYP